MSQQQKELHLSFLDQQPHIRVYGRYYIIFPFPDRSYTDAATNALRTGFREVLVRFPYLAGTVHIPPNNENQLQVLYPYPIDTKTEANRIFTSETVTNAELSYTLLAKSHFAPDLLPAPIFCPRLIAHHPGLDEGDAYAERMTTFSKKGERVLLPAFACQATFIPEGLVLSVWFYHAIVDGSGNRRIQEVWSTAVRNLTHLHDGAGAAEVLTGSDIPRSASGMHQGVGGKGEKDADAGHDASAARRALSDFVVRSNHLKDGVHDSESLQTSLSLPPLPLRSASYTVVTKLFRFPSPLIKNLRTHLCSLTGTHISLFSALAALIWAHILRARLPLLIASRNTTSTLAVVVDLRKYLPAPFSDDDYLGNLVYSTMPTWTLLSKREQEGEGIAGMGQADRVVLLEPKLPFPHPTINDMKKQSLPPVMTIPAPPPLPLPPLPSPTQTPSPTSLAAKITASILDVNGPWITPHLSTVLSLPFEQTPHGRLRFSNGPDLYITSWTHMGVGREWCVPGAGSREPSCIRRAAWVSEGGVVVLPRKRDVDGEEDAFEVMVSLAEEDMRAFEQGVRDAGWLEKEEEGVRARL